MDPSKWKNPVVAGALVLAGGTGFYLGASQDRGASRVSDTEVGRIAEQVAAGLDAPDSGKPELGAEAVQAVADAVAAKLDGTAIDVAVDRGIERYVAAREEERRQAQEAQLAEQHARVQGIRRPDPERDHMLGDPDARFTLVEYSDFECPYCKTFHEVGKQWVASREDVNWVFRHLPLRMHNPLAMRQALASECMARLGGNETFWRYADAVFAETQSGGSGMAEERLDELAVQLGIDGEQLGACMEDEATMGRVTQDVDDATSVGIEGTPGNVIVDNKTGEAHALRGAVPIEELLRKVEELL